MSDNREIAAGLLNEAAETVVNRRPGVHGSAENSFEMIGELWSVYLSHKAKLYTGADVKIPISAADVAQLMSMLKKARFMYGNPDNPDNFVDDLGYTALSGMIQLPSDPVNMSGVIANVDPEPTPFMEVVQKQHRASRPEKKPNVTHEVIDAAEMERAIKNQASADPDTENEAKSASELLNKIYATKDRDDASI